MYVASVYIVYYTERCIIVIYTVAIHTLARRRRKIGIFKLARATKTFAERRSIRSNYVLSSRFYYCYLFNGLKVLAEHYVLSQIIHRTHALTHKHT